MGLFTLHNFCVSLHFLKLELDSKSRFPIFQMVLVLTVSWLMNTPKSLNSILYSKYPFFNSRQPYHYVPLSQCLNHKPTLSPPPSLLPACGSRIYTYKTTVFFLISLKSVLIVFWKYVKYWNSKFIFSI